jgi:hypothetical protein
MLADQAVHGARRLGLNNYADLLAEAIAMVFDGLSVPQDQRSRQQALDRLGDDRHRRLKVLDQRSGSSHLLASRHGSALARQEPLRVGRNARPKCHGNHPARGQGGAPAGRPTSSDPHGRRRRGQGRTT